MVASVTQEGAGLRPPIGAVTSGAASRSSAKALGHSPSQLGFTWSALLPQRVPRSRAPVTAVTCEQERLFVERIHPGGV